jgi:hypothetical protein
MVPRSQRRGERVEGGRKEGNEVESGECERHACEMRSHLQPLMWPTKSRDGSWEGGCPWLFGMMVPKGGE